MFHDINKKTFGLEIIFLLDPVIEQVNMDTNLLPIKYFEPAAHMYTEVQRLNNGKYKFLYLNHWIRFLKRKRFCKESLLKGVTIIVINIINFLANESSLSC